MSSNLEATGRGRILFADDEELVRRTTGAALRAAGFELTLACNGKEVSSAIAKASFDALLLDVDMPGNENLEVLQSLKAHPSVLPVVILTGRPSLETAIRSVRLGVVDYLTKPPGIEELCQCLDSAVHRGRVLRSVVEATGKAQELATLLNSLQDVIRAGPGGLTGTPRTQLMAGLSKKELSSLSPREQDIVRELSLGNPSPQVAKSLKLSPNTVRNHLKSVYLKLGVNSQVALLAKLGGHAPR